MILHHNFDSGLIVGRANDKYGESGIVGIIKQNRIKFEKFYIRNPNIKLTEINFGTINCHRNFRIIEYFGEIAKLNNKITAEGIYHMSGLNERMSGKWTIDSI